MPARRPLPALLLALAAGTVAAQQGDGTDARIAANVVKPDKVDPTPQRIARLQVPPGFTVEPFATGLRNPRILAVSPAGHVYVSRRDQGDVLLLKDEDGDGRADGTPIAVANRPGAHGLAIHDGRLYIATATELYAGEIQPDGTLGQLELLAGDFPDAGQHPNRTMAFGPDGWLYYSAGSTCNACNESNPENATLLRVSADGRQRSIFASGLRNMVGFGWHPATGELWGMDHNTDFLGDDEHPEELNRIEKGKRYGWPHVGGSGTITPWTTPDGGITKEQWRDMSEPMVMGYTAHAAPMQMVFYPGGNFPEEYTGDAFVAMRGSWNRRPPSGYEIVRIRFERGEPQAIEPFVTGFLTDGGRTHFARPVGLAVAPDGALLMSDDGNGSIYRIRYEAGGRQAGSLSPPATAMQAQAQRGSGVPLASEREETAMRGDGGATIQVSSHDFQPDGPLHQRFSEYAEGVSPALAWTPVEGARSYMLIMEDPDARSVTPYVHWVAWNIPAHVTRLPQGLQEQERLTEPEGMLQGATSRGMPGYYGPRPPVGDLPHRYHFQVFALDVERLDAPPGADRDTVLAAAAGHVIAKGTLVGTYQQTVEPPL
ncbi:YbhB/YbcL family Raf kinase inhibitor-like protein [Coralloluteibacterium thermophilus]|uniref:YbhB/YbcL family Raf kinase inhibitor-like protein n=1 Tax=Coralloluteibacterium thermophilum TaxID=2707049 RepID=A0ABV9NRW0_9GAMM